MTRGKPRNVAASVRQRLANLAREQGEDFGLLLTTYALERLLYRLSLSQHKDRMVLKGAMLFRLWIGHAHRPTRDLDLLGKGDNSIAALEQVFRDLCAQPTEDDGLDFHADTIKGETIKEDEEYQGVRIQMEVRLANARIFLQVDIGFGDVITPGPTRVEFPAVLDLPRATVWAYPRETVVAEKYQAMVALGITNSRMKDFFDVWFLAHTHDFDGELLSQALRATFARRGTSLPAEMPVALTPAFCNDPIKLTQWRAFLTKNRLDAEGVELDQVAASIREFLFPPSEALVVGTPFHMTWRARGPWSPG
jgi:predicted nucleotidyltransferase component of viral defense system